MRRTRLVLSVAGLLMLAPILAACSDFDLDKLDVFGLNEKKKLPGERRPLFPEGVPGVSQGVPPDLVKGYQPPPEAAAAEPAADEKAAEAEKPKPKAARKPKPRVATKPVATPTAVTIQPAAQGQVQQPADPAWTRADQQRTAPPSQGAQQPSPGSSPWPSSPAPGAFQR
ncbi:MAG: hypothetical protein ACR2K5_06020 [Pseudolabrys sp.]